MANPNPDIWGSLISKTPKVTKHDILGGTQVLFLGSEKSGKSTVQGNIFNQSEEPSPTFALNYFCSSLGTTDRAFHFWELGGGLSLENVLSTIITEENKSNFITFVCFDLTKYASIQEAIEWANRLETHLDQTKPVFFVGTHYDTFSSQDTQTKNRIVHGLRALAAFHNYGLIFTSKGRESDNKKLQILVKQVIIDNKQLRLQQLDSNDLIVIGPGSDNEAKGWTEILGEFMNQVADEASIELSKSPQSTNFLANNPKFAEEEIDSLRATKMEELRQMKDNHQ